MGYHDRKAVHNLKYFTWVEQGKTSEELNAQWRPEYWEEMFTAEISALEQLIADFNREVGLRRLRRRLHLTAWDKLRIFDAAAKPSLAHLAQGGFQLI